MAAEQLGESSEAAAVMAEAVTGPTTTWSAGVGFGPGQLNRTRAPRVVVGLEGAMRTPEEMLVMHKLLELGWSRRRITAELGISRNTLDRYLSLGEWQPYNSANRSGQLDEHMDWLRERFEQHHGNAEVVRQELVKQKGIDVSLHTVEWRCGRWGRSAKVLGQALP